MKQPPIPDAMILAALLNKAKREGFWKDGVTIDFDTDLSPFALENYGEPESLQLIHHWHRASVTVMVATPDEAERMAAASIKGGGSAAIELVNVGPTEGN